MLINLLNKLLCQIPCKCKDGKYRKGAISSSHIGKEFRKLEIKATPIVAACLVSPLIYKGLDYILDKSNEKKKSDCKHSHSNKP